MGEVPIAIRRDVGPQQIRIKITYYNYNNKPNINIVLLTKSDRTKIVFITFTQTFFECWLINLLPKG